MGQILRGILITFEGGEGCGKSTQARLLYKRLRSQGFQALLTREPGGTKLGRRIRNLLKHRMETGISPEAELLLFNASRVQLVREVIQPAIGKGIVVICDRFYDSTTAYQGYGRGLDLPTVMTINRFAASGIRPDLTILLDISPEQGLKRKSHKEGDRFEQEDIEFHRRVRAGYLKLASMEPERWLILDGSLPRREIATQVWHRVKEMVSQADIVERR